ncbi:hypothetical protein [Streptomyces sp. NPDC059757]|uniref:hypothetical protein n=1 Tax=Streptomyces sp. NPDC059757 TaxID=3346935 RepID=UPI003651BF1A
MTFTTSGVAAAGIKATGSITAALIGRYRPTGVPRLFRAGPWAHGPMIPSGRGCADDAEPHVTSTAPRAVISGVSARM